MIRFDADVDPVQWRDAKGRAAWLIYDSYLQMYLGAGDMWVRTPENGRRYDTRQDADSAIVHFAIKTAAGVVKKAKTEKNRHRLGEVQMKILRGQILTQDEERIAYLAGGNRTAKRAETPEEIAADAT